MRFIAEFEIKPPYTKAGLESHNAYAYMELGSLIGSSFGWEERGQTTLDPKEPVTEVHKLSIEAFPMDKWVEFKRRLFVHLGATGLYEPAFKDLINELESYGAKKEPL